MWTALRKKITIPASGRIEIDSPMLKPGTKAEVIVLVEKQPADTAGLRSMTASDLLTSGVVGLWANRKDLGDSLEYARQLRQIAERRGDSE